MDVSQVAPIRKRIVVKFTDQEIIHFLRAYIDQPSNWREIVRYIQDNLDNLPVEAQEYYRTSSIRQIRYRLSNKLNILLMRPVEAITNIEIRNLVSKLREKERDYIQLKTPSVPKPVPSRPENQPRTRVVRPDECFTQEQRRDRRHQRKRPLVELVRENHELYNRWMTVQLPKLERELGLMSSDDDA